MIWSAYEWIWSHSFHYMSAALQWACIPNRWRTILWEYSLSWHLRWLSLWSWADECKNKSMGRSPPGSLNSSCALSAHSSSLIAFFSSLAVMTFSRSILLLVSAAFWAWLRWSLAFLLSVFRSFRLAVPSLQVSILHWKSFWQFWKALMAETFWKTRDFFFSSWTVRISLAGRRVGCSCPAASYSLQIAILLDPCDWSFVSFERTWISTSETRSWFHGSESKPCHCSSMSILLQKLLSFWKAGRLAAYRSLETLLALQRSLATTEGPRTSSSFTSSHKSPNTLLQISRGSFVSSENLVIGRTTFHRVIVFLHCSSRLWIFWSASWARLWCIASLVSRSRACNNSTAAWS